MIRRRDSAGGAPRGAPALLALAVLAVAGCTESNDFVSDIGTTRLFFVDPGLLRQRVSDPQVPIQVAEWQVQQATLIDGEGRILDLLAGGSCSVVDTAFFLTSATGKCSSGLVIGSSDEAQTVTLSLRFTMQVRRAEPVDLPATADEDQDGVNNARDNCPLEPNADQEDMTADGIGDACSLLDPISHLEVLDSDADGVEDVADNCVWFDNPMQENTSGVNGDQIGDACTEQIGQVQFAGSATIEFSPPPLSLVQPRDVVSFLVVDFDDPGALSCDWAAGTCELNPARVRACVATSLVSAAAGCP